MTNRYRNLPSVDKVLSHPTVSLLLSDYSREVVAEVVREALEVARDAIAKGGASPTLNELAETVVGQGLQQWAHWPISVINATGVILHTNLGRAPLSKASILAITMAAREYSNLETDLTDGHRGSRFGAVVTLLSRLTGAEDGLVINNNAGALLLGLAALSTGQEVIVSRGEAVEIGGGFRIPEVLRESGAHLVEVGTVNRTYAHDYVQAITSQTSAILVVHRSNFQVIGFTHTPTLVELSKIAHEHDIPLLHDLGSGAFLDTESFGLPHEPTPQESIHAGADLTFFSGDKLLGGPQAGIVVGKTKLVQHLARHPMARALRVDKLTLAALHATLLHYLKGEARNLVPIWRMIAASSDGMERRVRSWAKSLGASVEVKRGYSTIGGGSMPGELLKTWLLEIDPAGIEGGAEGLSHLLRIGEHPILTRIEENRVIIDPRTVLPGQDRLIVTALEKALPRQGSKAGS